MEYWVDHGRLSGIEPQNGFLRGVLAKPLLAAATALCGIRGIGSRIDGPEERSFDLKILNASSNVLGTGSCSSLVGSGLRRGFIPYLLAYKTPL